MKSHPMQPVQPDAHGTLRFRRNNIVCHLLDHGGIDMNALARMDFTREDRVQFAQLIGYSVDGASCLSYFSDADVAQASQMAEGADPRDARIAALEKQLAAARDGMRAGVAELFEIHPDDLADRDDR